MAAKTTWGPAPWLPKQTWLLKDNSVIQTPDLETTTSGQRVRIAGTTKSFSKNQLVDMMTEAAKEIAAQRLTGLWTQLTDDDETRRHNHGAVSPGPGRVTNYTKAEHLVGKGEGSASDHTQITFEFESVDCPALTVTVWVIVNKYSYRGDTYQTLSALTYPIVHEDQSTLSSYTGDSWWTPFRYYSQSDSKAFLAEHKPIPGLTFVNDTYTGPRPAIVEALKMVKIIRDVEYIDIPVWREPEAVSLMRFKFKRTNLTSQLYNDMVEAIQVQPTLDRIKENYRQIQHDLTALGIVLATPGRNNFLEITEGAFAEEVVCHMIPLTEDGQARTEESGTTVILEDHAHTVSVDLLSGTIVVNCTQRDTEVLDHWNFERTKAELHGELDAFLGFARQKQQSRSRKTFRKIMKDRTPEDIVVSNDDEEL